MQWNAAFSVLLLLAAIPAAAAQERPELTPEEVQALESLETDLVGPIASIDHGLARAGMANQMLGTRVYSRMRASGFPGAAVNQVNFADGIFWMLGAPMQYRPGNARQSVTVPAGFVHDFASIPAIATPIVPKYGPYNNAAIVHDFLYWAEPCTRLQADNLLLIAMIEAGVEPWRRWGIYKAVRLAGWGAWSDNQDERAEGLPRIVPPNYVPFPAATRWDGLRQTLVHDGVGASIDVADKAFCALGNSAHVPEDLLAEAAPAG